MPLAMSNLQRRLQSQIGRGRANSKEYVDRPSPEAAQP